MRRYRVLFVTSWYPNHTNPMAGVFVREHATAVRQSDEVCVLHSAGYLPSTSSRLWSVEQEGDRELTQGIATFRVRHPRGRIPHTSFALQAAAHWKAIDSIRRRGFTPDLLHAHVYTAGALAVIYGRAHGIPVIVTEHNSAFPRRLLTRRQRRIAQLAFRGAQWVLPVSHALQKGIEGYGFHPRCVVIPNTVDVELFAPPNESSVSGLDSRRVRRLLFVGSLIEVKGVPYLLDALALVNRQRCDWHLDIVGDGAMRSLYVQQTRALGLEEQVTFHGYQPKTVVADLMQSASCFVLASVWENLPCVLIEATASGLPIIAAQVGGIPEIVDSHSGVLVPSKSAPRMAEAILGFLAAPDRYDRMAIARAAQRFSYANVGAAIHEVYAKCLP